MNFKYFAFACVIILPFFYGALIQYTNPNWFFFPIYVWTVVIFFCAFIYSIDNWD